MARRFYNKYDNGPEKTGFSPDQMAWFLSRIVLPGMVLGALAWVLVSMWWRGEIGLLSMWLVI